MKSHFSENPRTKLVFLVPLMRIPRPNSFFFILVTLSTLNKPLVLLQNDSRPRPATARSTDSSSGPATLARRNDEEPLQLQAVQGKNLVSPRDSHQGAQKIEFGLGILIKGTKKMSLVQGFSSKRITTTTTTAAAVKHANMQWFCRLGPQKY